jgi:hypothetical protein
MVTETDDLDALLARLDEKRASLEDAIARVEAEHAAGRTGHTAFVRTQMIQDDYLCLHAIAQDRVAQALAELARS